MTDWGRQTCSQISQLTTSIRALLNRLAVRLEKEVQPASLRTGRTSFHSSRLTSLLSIVARTLLQQAAHHDGDGAVLSETIEGGVHEHGGFLARLDKTAGLIQPALDRRGPKVRA